jgi:hypothetical protein
MQTVQLPGTHVTATQLADTLRHELGTGYHVSLARGDEVKIRKGPFQRARITITDEPGGTEFGARGESIRLPIPLCYPIIKQMNDRGIAARCIDVISHSATAR